MHRCHSGKSTRTAATGAWVHHAPCRRTYLSGMPQARPAITPLNRLKRLVFPRPPAWEGPDDNRWALSVLIRVRFAHVLLQAGLLVPVLAYGWMLPPDIPYYVGALLLLTAFNAVSLRIARGGTPVSGGFLLLQNAADLIAMTLLFGIAGGLTNPAHILIHFQVGLAGLLLAPGIALAVLAFAAAVLAVLASAARSLTDPYTWVGPLGSNLAYEWLLATAIAALAISAARLNRHYRDRLLQELERSGQRDRLRAAGAVASGFCHELASPLNAATLIAGRLERREANPSPERAEEWTELRESLARCERIVRGMAGTPWDPEELSLQTADAGVLLRKIASEWAGKSPLHVRGSSGDSRVAAPAVGLGQTLLNLLRNADEASPEAGEIEASIGTDGGSIVITVSDRGLGVDPAVERDLGTPFNSRKGSGRGLGLFSALHFVEALGGSLTLAPRPGGGTSVRLSLPRAREDGGDNA